MKNLRSFTNLRPVIFGGCRCVFCRKGRDPPNKCAKLIGIPGPTGTRGSGFFAARGGVLRSADSDFWSCRELQFKREKNLWSEGAGRRRSYNGRPPGKSLFRDSGVVLPQNQLRPRLLRKISIISVTPLKHVHHGLFQNLARKPKSVECSRRTRQGK